MAENFIYNTAIKGYRFLTKVAAAFNEKARQRVDGLVFNQLVISEMKGDRAGAEKWPLAWFHAASLGEFEQARPLLERFRERHPDYKIAVTFFSPSGYEVRKNYPYADYIFYLPFDTEAEMRPFIAALQPTLVFWIKYDYWHNCLNLLAESGVPVHLVSAIFRPEQPFFKPYGRFFRETLRSFSRLFVQDGVSEHLLQSIGLTNIQVAGDTRFDRVADNLKNVKSIELVERFKGNHRLLVVGSAWPADVAVVKDFDRYAAERNLRLIIAPHEIHEHQMAEWKKHYFPNAILYSEAVENPEYVNHNVLIINNIGLLSSIYQYAEAAFIGGAFGKGLHNILEAATFGMPIYFGNKNYKKFKEANDLIAIGGAFPVADAAEFWDKLLLDGSAYEVIKNKVSTYVEANTGASEKILAELGM